MLRNLCRYESLKDGTLDLADLALMNELLDVETANQRIFEEYHRGR